MKKAITLAFLLSCISISFAQVANTGWSGIKKLGVLPQNNPSFTIEAFKQLSCSQGEDQWGEIVITNNSSKRCRIEGTVVITTTCLNEVVGNFFAFLDPHGGSTKGMYGWVVWTHAKGCDGTKYKDSDGYTQYDRIKMVAYKNFTFKEVEIGNSSNDNNTNINQPTPKKTGNQPLKYIQPTNKTTNTNAQAESIKQQQLVLLNQQKKRQEQLNQKINDGLQNIADIVTANMIKKSIREEDTRRNNKFQELNNDVNTKKGELISCDRCNGNGFTKCDYCDGNGQKPCSVCTDGSKTICFHCNGTGNKFCFGCYGTGKNFKEGSNDAEYSQQNNTNSLTEKNQEIELNESSNKNSQPFESMTEQDKLELGLSNLIGTNYTGSFGSIEKNVPKAIQIYNSLTEDYNSLLTRISAMFSLSRIYEQGLDGNGKNLVKSTNWIVKAGEVLRNCPSSLLSINNVYLLSVIGELYEFGKLGTSNTTSSKTTTIDLNKSLFFYKKILSINNIQKYYQNDYIPPMLIENDSDEKINRLQLVSISRTIELKIKRVQEKIK